DFDVGFGWRREAEFDSAIAVVGSYFAGGVFNGHGIAVGTQSDVAWRIDDFKIAGAGFHVAGKRRKRKIGALGNEAEAFGDFVGADGSVEFAVEREAARGGGDVDLSTLTGNSYIAFGVADFDVAFVHFDVDVAGGVADFDITAGARYGNGRGHVGDGD